jgi:hypothetical protein
MCRQSAENDEASVGLAYVENLAGVYGRWTLRELQE